MTAEQLRMSIINEAFKGDWKIVSLGNVCAHENGDRGKNYPSKDKLGHEGIPFISALNLANNTIIDDDKLLKASEIQYNNLRSGHLKKGDFVVCIRGSIGKHCIFPFEKGAIASSLVILRPDEDKLNLMWLSYYFDSGLFQDSLSESQNGTAQPNLGAKELMKFKIPLPPLAEQQRIVAKLEELLPIVEQYGKAQAELDELNAALPSRLRQSILQQAIQGKLVPQDKNETVDELVHSLQRALKESPIKKKWCPEEIQEDELPFDIPDNWKWVRLGDIIYTQTGLSYSKGDLEKKVANPVRVLRGGNIKNGSWCIKDDDVMIAPEFVKKDIFLKKNCFITPAVTSLEHLGKTALIREDHNDIVAGGFVLYLMPYDATNDELMEYLAYFFQSALYNSFCKTITNKSGQAFWNISREKLLQLPIPLPPLAEQQRIVAKIEELFAEIDKLK